MNELCREGGIHRGTFNLLKKKYGGWKSKSSNGSGSGRRKTVNSSRCYVELALVNKILKDVLRKKVLSHAYRRRRVDYIRESYPVGISRACKQAGYPGSGFYYRPVKNNPEVADAFRDYAERFRKYGFWLLFKRMRREGITWNHKRVYRIYKLLRFSMRRKGKRRPPPQGSKYR